MTNSENYIYKYFLFKEKKIFNFEEKPSAFLFVEYNDVEVAYLNVIDAFQRKYTINEIQEQKQLVTVLFNSLIEPIKEVLVYFSKGKLEMHMTNDQISDLFCSVVLLKEKDIDSYYDSIAKELRSVFFSFICSGELLTSLPSSERTLFTYLDRHNNSFSLINIMPDTWITLCDVEEAIHFFLDYFKRLIKISKLFDSFFSLLLNKNKNEDQTLYFSKFFLAYEYNMLFDLVLHIKQDEEQRNIVMYTEDVWVNNAAYFCLDFSKKMLYSFFQNVEGHLIKDLEVLFDCFLFTQLEDIFKQTLLNKTYDFNIKMEQIYLGSIFTVNMDNQYQALCHDAFEHMIDFKYILGIISTLKYGYYINQEFLDDLLNNTNA